MLQCAIPCIEGLIPNGVDDKKILDLLFIATFWHGLAKLEMHNDDTIALLKAVTCQLGKGLRDFKAHVCPNYKTFETQKEADARHAREERKQKAKVAMTEPQSRHPSNDATTDSPHPTSPTSVRILSSASVPFVDGHNPEGKGKGKACDQGEELNGRKRKVFNLSTYKTHALGDYALYIPIVGTSDNWSTDRVRGTYF